VPICRLAAGILVPIADSGAAGLGELALLIDCRARQGVPLSAMSFSRPAV